MICTLENGVALHVRVNSYSMIAKPIYLRWTKRPSLERPTWAKSREHCSEKAQGQMHKREASRQSSLRAAISEQLKRLIENLTLPVPELSPNMLGKGNFCQRTKKSC